MDEVLTSWFGQHCVRSLCASHLRFNFTSLHETKKRCAGEPLLGGFCLTGLDGSCRTADEHTRKVRT
jgi:hypothetical protein